MWGGSFFSFSTRQPRLGPAPTVGVRGDKWSEVMAVVEGEVGASVVVMAFADWMKTTVMVVPEAKVSGGGGGGNGICRLVGGDCDSGNRSGSGSRSGDREAIVRATVEEWRVGKDTSA